MIQNLFLQTLLFDGIAWDEEQELARLPPIEGMEWGTVRLEEDGKQATFEFSPEGFSGYHFAVPPQKVALDPRRPIPILEHLPDVVRNCQNELFLLLLERLELRLFGRPYGTGSLKIKELREEDTKFTALLALESTDKLAFFSSKAVVVYHPRGKFRFVAVLPDFHEGTKTIREQTMFSFTAKILKQHQTYRIHRHRP